ncbi:predicted protein [Nematostella vectensis]|uniref:Uncharacterized protein n=1 Tax=Nematostella vectensis TaxID=45351 RepID=A7SQQ4_NEMVE|nr:predicted protein [Nematostella vectensis]|eukprot:XP_001626051.1 predicted protein [Nematostella vectensis]
MHPKFDEEFLELAETDEFKALMRQQILPGIKQFEAKFSVLSGRFWMQCLTALQSSLKQRDQLSADGRERFARQVTKAAQELRTKLQERDKGLLRARSQQSARNAIDWLLTKRRLTSERAPWAYRTPEEVHWKLSTEETFQRMRLRMTQNLNYSYHMEASNARDNKSDENLDGDTLSQSVPLRVAREAVVMRSLEADEDEELTASNNSVSPPMSVVEKVVLEVDCELVTLMDVMPGKLKVSTTHVYFTANRSSDAWDLTTVYEFTWALAELREVHLRRHNLRRSALEFFLVDQTNYFINCSKKARNTVYKKIMSLRPPNLYYMGARSPAQLLKASGLTERWVKREISNFEYLMQLNTIAGRTYNDLSQYPVFPWVLVDYESKDLDLSNRAVYRDLSKPIGVLNPARVKEVEDRYKHFEDPTGTIAKFHYGTHYSNSANVLFYLLRVEPFTTLHVALHSGRFDCADRQFHSIPALWDSLFNKASDVKELVPEFFYFPEFLENLNGFDLGRLQGGARVNHVTLPPWARTPEEFVHKHRQALESEYVSTHLHDWIDLIFGYKQRGEKAVEAHNVFYYCTYEGAVDLDAITNEAERIATEGMINNFGQTPSQLLTTPHPVRMTQADAAAHKQKALEIAGTSKPLANVFEHVDKLKAYFVVVTDSCDPLVFAAVPRVQARLLIHHGMPDCMVTVTRSGILGNQDWLPYSKTKSRPFTFELDPALSSVKLRRTVAGPFSPDVTVTSRHFAMTQDARLIITAGHWDNTIRVFSIKGKLQSRITAHSDTVTCLSIDRDGHHLMTGSRDTTCRLWLVSHVGGWAADVDKSPLQTLYGHDHEVTCVVLSWELDMAVSGSRDGTCIVHTARKGQYLRTLRPMGNEPSSAPCRVTSLGLSEFGGIIVSSNTRDARALTHYSINGRLLAQERALKDDVIDIEICGDFVVTGGNSGRLGIRSLHSMNLLVPITSVSLAKDNTHIFVTLCDGKLIVIAVDVPAT